MCLSIVMLHKNVEVAFVDFFVECCLAFYVLNGVLKVHIVGYGEDHCFIEEVLDYYCCKAGFHTTGCTEYYH